MPGVVFFNAVILRDDDPDPSGANVTWLGFSNVLRLMEESDWVRLTVPVNPLTLDRLMLTVAE